MSEARSRQASCRPAIAGLFGKPGSNANPATGARAPWGSGLPWGRYGPARAPADSTPPSPDVTRRARDLVERGEHFLRQALSKDTLEQALARFDLALRESPGHAPALVGMGRAW